MPHVQVTKAVPHADSSNALQPDLQIQNILLRSCCLQQNTGLSKMLHANFASPQNFQAGASGGGTKR